MLPNVFQDIFEYLRKINRVFQKTSLIVVVEVGKLSRYSLSKTVTYVLVILKKQELRRNFPWQRELVFFKHINKDHTHAVSNKIFLFSVKRCVDK